MIDLVTAAELCSRLKIGRDKLNELRTDPAFPKPVERLLPKLFWLETEIAQWLKPGEPNDASDAKICRVYRHTFIDVGRANAFMKFLGDDLIEIRVGDGEWFFNPDGTLPERDGLAYEFTFRRREALDEFWAHCREGK
ncbi:MAG: hypothetical protein E7773_11160 [Sphingomonas sp.]|uniref:helix-turn-helix transcriptional regulator n=1 Tax=Sphingomonas sp. TaxID=28214 RepID=UPI0011F5915A|nr:hypothetical protein [Sphingomonas sp.]THD35019.1 MAG: hypothetical protein E7773_11160 [Sphingomonas sp.]